MMTDPIADLLTRIRNANANGQKVISMPASRLKVNIAEVLKEEGFISAYKVSEGKPRGTLEISLKYGIDGERVVRSIRRVSKPGCRVYKGPGELPAVLGGMGMWLLSTPKGVLSDRGARAANVGGEVLARID
ncbi:MAG: 30S ribosomal protein S8 [Planctomycetes bacterium]|jgi:small subunit ribosomal protein S8|nr:30S ribosomal protein S8 [Planctomycetota bacterium]